MTDANGGKYVFFVFIIESPSAPDIYHGRSEGTRVADTLRLDGIPCVTRTAINREAFNAALTIGLSETMKELTDRYPILHISAHGSEDGIQLSSGEMVRWTELRDLLIPINESLKGALLLCMSACKGYSACQMAMQDGDKPHPYLVMIGNCGSPSWSDTAVAYLSFYHLLAKGHTVVAAVEAMGPASGDLGWVAEWAEQSKQGYLDFVRNRATPAAAQQQLEAAVEEQPIPADAKALELTPGG